ncbi:type I DNA topoisomerase [Owenweeksia hongkongensis]|uniref:type I DNA topoisomerase n=1 Tax=Owenweeksia hongkongensis TaxID=253245 RepID=UPI003A956EF6
MPKNLVIVESPAKAKTIEKYLGKDYQVESSYGHIRDLVKKDMGIDVENNFAPSYAISSDKKEVVKKLKALAKKADTVWLASDEDREGEAIAWHLAEALGLNTLTTNRIVFHEITKGAIERAIQNPRTIDQNLVDAQQARRILDRLVGYELSPVLWKKVRAGLSAGRVQSVAVRLIVEREREIQNFESTSYFRVAAIFSNKEGKSFKAELNKRFDTEKEAKDFLEKCKSYKFSIGDIDTKPAKKSPAAPFTTSTLQQEAARKLYFNVGQTMSVAQRLYESGQITYMRTDSVNLSDEAMSLAENEIKKSYGKEYAKRRKYSNKSKGAQEAHEAIRPTDMSKHNGGADDQQRKLYDLIWKRTLASQMSDAQLERTVLKIETPEEKLEFVARGEVIKFEGFLKVYLEGTDDEDVEEQEGMLPAMSKGESLDNDNIIATQRFTQHPPRFTEASLVKKLEELGIGRPSTYAPTISTIQKREYIQKSDLEGMKRNYAQLILKDSKIAEKTLSETTGADKNKLMPTDIGSVVNDFLVEHFKKVLDYNFTAKVEAQFDEIASGNEKWAQMIDEFYSDFHPHLKDVEENSERASGERLLGQDPESGKNVYARIGRFGPMVQIGEADDEEKPKFASLQKTQSIDTITFDEAMDLFQLPRTLGEYKGEEIQANVGRFGPYVKFGDKFISLDKGENPMDTTLDRAIELIVAKEKADAPIAEYENLPVQKGVGRFGPFIKWNGIFINVNKKYNFDNLTQANIEELIEDKKKKEREKVIHNWEDAGIRLEKARWGRFNLIKGKVKVELPKTTDAAAFTLEEAESIIEKNAPKKKTKPKAKTKAAPKKSRAKK